MMSSINVDMDSHYHQLERQAGNGKAAPVSYDGDLVRKSSSTSGCCDVTERHDDVISLRHSPAAAPASRSVYIHRPFEDVSAAPLQLTRRLVDVDYRLPVSAAVTGECGPPPPAPGRGCWPAHDGDGVVSWRRLETAAAAVGDDEVDSTGDSACCDDDDVTETQVRVAKATTGRRDDDHYQPEHCRKPGQPTTPYDTMNHIYVR